MISNIQALRGIFVIFIYLCHYKTGGAAIMPSGGDCGVAFFMMLSGFVLSAGYEERIMSASVSYRSFLRRRIAKVYPLHVLCFIWALGLADHDFGLKTVSEAVLNLAMLQSWSLSADYYFSFNSVSWFLSDIFFFYALFPIITGKRLIYRKNFILLFGALCLLYICVIPFVGEQHLNSIAYIFPASRLLDFIIGMLLWRLYRTCRDKKVIARLADDPSWKKTIAELSAIAILTVCIASYGRIDEAYRLAVYWWPCMALIIITFSFTDNKGGAISRMLSTRPLQAFGNMAFSFFMVHQLGIHTCQRAIIKAGLDTGEWGRFALTGIAVLILTLITHHALKRIKWPTGTNTLK